MSEERQGETLNELFGRQRWYVKVGFFIVFVAVTFWIMKSCSEEKSPSEQAQQGNEELKYSLEYRASEIIRQETLLSDDFDLEAKVIDENAPNYIVYVTLNSSNNWLVGLTVDGDNIKWNRSKAVWKCNGECGAVDNMVIYRENGWQE